MKEFADDQQYVESLKAAATTHPDVVERLIREGLDSGEPIELTDDWWEQKKTALSKLVGKTP